MRGQQREQTGKYRHGAPPSGELLAEFSRFLPLSFATLAEYSAVTSSRALFSGMRTVPSLCFIHRYSPSCRLSRVLTSDKMALPFHSCFRPNSERTVT